MDEGREDATADADESIAPLIYRGPRTQSEVDAIFARLRSWRECGRPSA